MALQPRIIACGNKVATFAMAVRFLTGPAVMAAASFAVGLRGTLLHVAIVQVKTQTKNLTSHDQPHKPTTGMPLTRTAFSKGGKFEKQAAGQVAGRACRSICSLCR
jgi:hypothetical protein